MAHSFNVDQRKFILYFTGYWVVWAALQAGLLNYYGFSGSIYVWDSLITIGLLAFVCVIVSKVFSNYQPSQDIAVYWCFLAGLATLVWGYADKWILETFIYPSSFGNWIEQTMPVRFVVGFLNVLWMMTAVYFREYSGSEQIIKEREVRMEQSVKDAELFKLRQQLHPHFLFNSLNSINALIHSRPEKAREMVQQLSAFLRGTLKQEENHFISLKDELDYLKLYLDIEMVRFGHRLKTEFDISDAALSCMMPPLMLQPLMENAIKYGVYGVTGAVKIRLRARLLDSYLIVTLTNPFDTDQQIQDGTGFGLTSIRRRLYLLFGRDDLLEINQGENDFVVIFRIPQS